MNNTGYFLFSLDTELGTGYFDEDAARHRLFSKDGIEERKRITRCLHCVNNMVSMPPGQLWGIYFSTGVNIALTAQFHTGRAGQLCQL